MSYEESARQVGAAADHELVQVRGDLTLALSQKAVIEQQLVDASTTLTVQADTIEGLTAELNAADTKIATLEAEVKRLKDLYEKPPALFGVTVDGAVRRTMPDLYSNVAVSRVYAQGATTWANEGQHKVFPASKWAVSNSWSLPESKIPAFLDSIPDTDKANIVGYAYGHELENPAKGLTGAQVRAAQQRTAPIIRARGLRVVSCLMGWTLAPASGRNWRDWIDPDSIDLLAWDVYNSGAKKNPPVYQDPAAMLDRIIAASVELGKPWALWETGTDQFGDAAPRAAWAKLLRDTIASSGGEHAIWFDRRSTSGSSWTAELDRASAEAWLG
jgi:hypothetical protein